MRYSGKKLALVLTTVYLTGFVIIFLTYRPASAETSPLSQTTGGQREVSLAEKNAQTEARISTEDRDIPTNTETLMIGPIRVTTGPIAPSQKTPRISTPLSPGSTAKS